MAVGYQVGFSFLALGRGGAILSLLSVLAIFFREVPLAAISKMRRTIVASLSFTSSFTPPSTRTLRYPNTHFVSTVSSGFTLHGLARVP
jgi:hypothetical protein